MSKRIKDLLDRLYSAIKMMDREAKTLEDFFVKHPQEEEAWAWEIEKMLDRARELWGELQRFKEKLQNGESERAVIPQLRELVREAEILWADFYGLSAQIRGRHENNSAEALRREYL